ncbi:MAG: universal stress protein [Eubacterium sp.]|nr:universal stress protein [Eubacterium sp.]
MENIMVCVTKQRNCQRLIDYGKKLMRDESDSIHIIHVTGSDYNFLGNSEEHKALEFLYEKAREAGAQLTVLKSDDTIATLCLLTQEHKITKVVVGASGENDKDDGAFLNRLKTKLNKSAELIVVSQASIGTTSA